MNVTVDRTELAKAVAEVGFFASKNKNFPLLASLSITALPYQLSVEATDLEGGGRYSLAGDVSQPGACLIPAQSMKDFMHSAAGAQVHIRSEEGRPIVVESNQSRITLRSTGGQLPVLPFGEPIAGVEIPAPKLAGMFARTAFVAQHASGLPVGDGAVNELTSAGVRFTSNGSITTLAHDGHRMARCVVEMPSPGRQFEFTVPARPASWLATTHWNETEVVNLEQVQGGMTLRGGPLTAFFRTTNVLMPDSSRAFSPEFEYRAVFDTEEFTRAISAVAHFADGTSAIGRAVTITFLPGEARIVAGSDFANAEAQEIIACEHRAPEMTFEFDPRYLVEFSRAVPSESVAMRFNSPAQICRFTHKGDPEFVYIVGSRFRKGAK